MTNKEVLEKFNVKKHRLTFNGYVMRENKIKWNMCCRRLIVKRDRGRKRKIFINIIVSDTPIVF